MQLTGKRQVVEDKAYLETEEGWWMREMDGTTTKPGPAPKGLAPDEKWIDVIKSRYHLGLDGSRVVGSATISHTGRTGRTAGPA